MNSVLPDPGIPAKMTAIGRVLVSGFIPLFLTKIL